MKKIVNSKNIRYFNKIDVIENKYIVKSFIGDDEYFKTKFFNEIIWMLKAQKLIRNYVPEIMDYSLSENALWMKYKMIKEKTIHDYFMDTKLKFSETFWNSFARESKKLFNNLMKNKPSIFIREEWKNNIYLFTLKRQLAMLKKLSIDSKFKIFFKKEAITINKSRFPSLKKIQEFLEYKINKIENENFQDENDIFIKLIEPKEGRICFAHLDLVFGNIFFNEKTKDIKIIDSRGSYINSNEYGDIYYDYAKYYQSIYGLYDFLAEDRFSVEVDMKNFSIEYEIEKPKKYDVIKKAFNVFFEDVDINVIKLIEAFQFLTMVPAHFDSYKRQIVELCISIQHFYEVIGAETWK